MKINVGVPSPPEYLKDGYDPGPIAHESTGTTIEYTQFKDVVEQRRAAEINFAALYSEFQSHREFNEKLLKKIRAFERFQNRIRKGYEDLQKADGSLMQTSKMLQKDLFIAERTLEDLQIENHSYLGTIQNHEETAKVLENEVLKKDALIESLNRKLELLTSKLNEKNQILEETEDQIQKYLFQMERITTQSAEVSKKYSSAQQDIEDLKKQLAEFRIREESLLQLNSDLANSFSKHQKKNPVDVESEPEKRTPNASQALSDFSKRWTHIIDELSSHSGRIGSLESFEVMGEATGEVAQAFSEEIENSL